MWRGLAGIVWGPVILGLQTSMASPVAQAAPPDVRDLPAGPASTMVMKLEKTFLKFDVLHVVVRVDPSTAG